MNRFQHTIFRLIIVVLTVVCACDSSTGTVNDSETGYTISGRVVDSDDNGVAGVSVTLSGGNYRKTVVTQENGIYTFSDVPNGSYTIICTKYETRFAPASREMFVDSANINIGNVYSMQNIPGIDGLTLAYIPGGTFQMGDFEDFAEENDDERPVHEVTVSSFEMSIYEVSNAQYAAYLNEALTSGEIEVITGDVYGRTGVWSGQQYIDIGYSYDSSNQCWITYNSEVFSVTAGHENWPVVMVSWYGAKAFAEHYGLDLPREAEWEYASRWGSHQYMYGTDNGTINSSKANYDYNIGHPIAVDSYPANPFGLYNMSGNVFEWCFDIYGSRYYQGGATVDPTGNEHATERVARGGSWINDHSICRSANRRCYAPRFMGHALGFRVVRRP